MPRTVPLTLTTLILLSVLQFAATESACSLDPDAVEIRVLEATTRDSIPAYFGEGPKIEHDDPISGQKSLFMFTPSQHGKSEEFYGLGSLEAAKKGFVVLYVELQVKGKSTRAQPFRIGDIQVRDGQSTRDFAATGTGQYLFVKNRGKDFTAASEERITIKAGEATTVKYAFLVSKDSPSWILKYRVKTITDLKTVAKPPDRQ